MENINGQPVGIHVAHHVCFRGLLTVVEENGWPGTVEVRYQGHPTDHFGKLSVLGGRPLIPYDFLKGIFTSNFPDMGNLRPSVFGLIKMSFGGTDKRSVS